MSLVLTNVSKTFGGTVALNNVDVAVEYGQVHALVGQNGSGKSTLIKLLAGYHQPDSGSHAELDGAVLTLGDPASARQLGLRFVHQDLGLVLTMSVLDNLMLGGRYPTDRLGRIRWREARRTTRARLQQLGVHINPRVPIGELTPAQRTAVAIGRALADAEEGQRRIIVLDEPTATLPLDEVDRLLATIRTLRERGHGVLLVSHHLNEVLDIADHITVLRDARVVVSEPRQGVDRTRLTELIVGHPVVVPSSADHRSNFTEESEPVLQVHALAGGRVADLEFSVRPGEILGIAGIAGSGRESVASLLVGRLPRVGRVRVVGTDVAPARPDKAIRAGIASIPGERGRFGVFENFTVRKNMTISGTERHQRWMWINRRAERTEVSTWIRRLGIRTSGGEAAIGSLSGGNQQKVLVARALRMQPKVLVLDDPTQGIDIGARAQVHEVIEGAVADGVAVVLTSTDSDEIARLADRVIVMVGGRAVRIMHRGPQLTANAIDRVQLDSSTTLEGSVS